MKDHAKEIKPGIQPDGKTFIDVHGNKIDMYLDTVESAALIGLANIKYFFELLNNTNSEVLDEYEISMIGKSLVDDARSKVKELAEFIESKCGTIVVYTRGMSNLSTEKLDARFIAKDDPVINAIFKYD